MKIKQLFVVLVLAAGASRAEAQLIGIDLGTSSNATPMTATSLAGAPGVRTAEWNSVAGPNASGSGVTVSSSSLMDNTGAPVSGLTFSFTSGTTNYGGSYNAATPTTNDTLLYDSVFDQYNGTPGTFSLTNVPYATYNLYVYVFSDTAAAARGGSITVGGLTYYIAGGTVANPDSTGAGYVQSTDTTSLTSSAEGNYVEFTGLTASTLNGSFVAATVAGGDSTDRLKIAGFEIQEVTSVPEPSTDALLLAGVCLLAVRLRAQSRA